MSDAIGPQQLDALVAAILTATRLHGLNPEGCIAEYRKTLQALTAAGSVMGLLHEAYDAAPKAKQPSE